MQTLVSIIGEAPSEVSEEVFLERLRKERLRVVTALDAFKYSPPAKKKAVGIAKKYSALEQQLKALGMTVDEFIAKAKQPEEDS